MSFVEESNLNIPFLDIKLATKDFAEVIGKGGYGLVYKGQLALSGALTDVAVKRLDKRLWGQGLKEFLTEIYLLSSYKHPNLISLLGFCNEGEEKILVYEYADRGSLDKYLISSTLTWTQRVKICLDAARGLHYLHNQIAQHQRVIHRDIKSANILLDGVSKAIISDLGLSKIGRANENDTFLITNACGTQGYCDPAYIDTGILTKESDVYSFGVVLFEVLCGRPCFMNVDNERRFLAPLARRHYENGKLEEIIDRDLREQMDLDSLTTFSNIAYECVHKDRERRPSMFSVVTKLEEAVEYQCGFSQVSQEVSQPTVISWGRRPAALRALSQRMSKGFNKAVNGFTDEGWSAIESDWSDWIDDVTVLVNLTPVKVTGVNPSHVDRFPSIGNAVLCVKASMILQDVSPATLIRILRESRSEWADRNIDEYLASSVKGDPGRVPLVRTRSFGQDILPLAHTIEHEEFMEVIKLENMGHYPDILFLQLCSGIDENAKGPSAELVFAPIDEPFTDDTPLLTSGFRVVPINKNRPSQNPTRDLISALEVVPLGPSGPTKSVMTIAFQFVFKIDFQENVATMARQYMHGVVTSVKKAALALSPSPFGPPSDTPDVHTLARWICQSYSRFLGKELCKTANEPKESVLQKLWHHSEAIMCCSLKAPRVFTFANQAGLDMLEVTRASLQEVMLKEIFDDSRREQVSSNLLWILQQGAVHLEGGLCVEQGDAGVVRASRRMEGVERRRVPSFYRVHVLQLVVRLTLRNQNLYRVDWVRK